MLHLMKYSLLTKVKNISAIFWPLIFPLLLATMMYFAVGTMEESDFETIPVALVAETDLSKGERGVQTEEVFQAFLSSVETDSELIHVEEMTGEQALKALENREVKGIFYSGSGPSLTVGSNGLAETILQMLLESYSEGKQTMEDIARPHPQGMEAAVRQMAQSASAVEQVSLGGRTTNGSAQAFYAVIGMACLYGCFLGFGSAMEIQANLTALAARRCAGPVHRMKMVFSEIIVCFGLHFANTLILLTYMKYILRLEFAGSCAEMVPVLLVGSRGGKDRDHACLFHDVQLSGRNDERRDEKFDRSACPFHKPHQSGGADFRRPVLPECLRRSKALCTGPCHIVRAVRPAGGGYISDCKEETLWQYLKPI